MTIKGPGKRNYLRVLSSADQTGGKSSQEAINSVSSKCLTQTQTLVPIWGRRMDCGKSEIMQQI